MAIRCPNCQHAIELAQPKPGHFRPTCPTCRVKFDLLITKDPNEPPRVSKLPEIAATQAPATAANVPAVQATQPPPSVDRSQYFTESPSTLAYDDLHGRLGGYQLVRKLGQGGMGSVYLARQLSLDRDVALKTLSPTLAEDPQFVARFTREAYAAAQLTHHNVVQIHDIGQDKGTNFFSMELVDGTTLAGLVERDGRLDPITAVTYALQAARGLKFAHDHGLIHRDVKPENLLLNNDGMVKVADLGLVKRSGVKEIADTSTGDTTGPAATTTQLNTSMGTPAYMAPEQARDATKVDGRADVYSLGCTLYDLITGRPPFSGTSAIEVMTKHQKQPITPPEKIVANLPKRLSEIITRMTAKQPEARYPTMGAVVKDLEDFLGVEHGGSVRGAQDQIAVVGAAVERFNAAPFARVRFNLLLAFALVSVLSLAIGLLTFSPWLAGGAIAIAAIATLAYQLVLGVRQRTVVFAKVRQLIFGASPLDWLTWLVGALVLVAILWGQAGTWLGIAVVAIIVGVSFHFVVDHVVAVQREEPLADTEKLIRALRVKGIDEDGIRGFVAKFSGRDWEAFYEALFGYESKIEARRLYGKGERGRDRRRHATWRDWLIGWIDRKLEARKVERERRLLMKLEQRAFEARGIRDEAAESQAHAAAAAVVTNVAAMKGNAIATARDAETLAPQAVAAPQRRTAIRPEWLDADVPAVSESLEGYQKTGYLRRRYGGPLDILLGRRVRFLLAAVVLIGAGTWARANGMNRMMDELQTFGRNLQQTKTLVNEKAGAIADAYSPVNAKTTKVRPALTTQPAVDAEEQTPTDPLRVPGVPDGLCDAVGSWNGLLAGALLLLSVLPYGHLMSFVVIGACGIALFGHHASLPAIGEPARWMTGAVGAGLSLMAMLFFRRSEE